MTHFDGNEAAGALSEVFAVDVTTAIATCGECGTTGALAEVHVYEGPGTVLRCPGCEAVLLRFVRTRTGACLEMCNVRVLRFP